METSMKRCVDLLGQAEILSLRNSRSSKLKRCIVSAMREMFIEPTLPAVRVSALALFCFNNGIDLVTHATTEAGTASFTVRAHGDTFDVSSV